jgi:hypothetical protein
LRDKIHVPSVARCEVDLSWFVNRSMCFELYICFRWPTIGIDLKSPHPDHNTEAEYVWLPKGNRGGLLPTWNHFESHGVFGFVGAILDVMQNWRDNLQVPIPGYRDRTSTSVIRTVKAD